MELLFKTTGKFNRIRKKIIFTVLFLATSYSTAQPQKDIFGRANAYSGKYVFWGSTPKYEYDVVFNFKFTYDIWALYYSQSAQSEEGIKSAYFAASGRDFDAILVGESQYDVAIKFRDSAVDNSICRPLRINDVSIFIDAIPVNEYSTIETEIYKRKKTGLSKTIVYNSMNISRNLTRKKPKSSALIIGNTNNHEWITIE